VSRLSVPLPLYLACGAVSGFGDVQRDSKARPSQRPQYDLTYASANLLGVHARLKSTTKRTTPRNIVIWCSSTCPAGQLEFVSRPERLTKVLEHKHRSSTGKVSGQADFGRAGHGDAGETGSAAADRHHTGPSAGSGQWGRLIVMARVIGSS
jgi:hypothetical protein